MSCQTLQQCYMRTSAELAMLVNRLEGREGVSKNLVDTLKKAQLLVPKPPAAQVEAKWEELLLLREHPPEVAFRIWGASQQAKEREARMSELRESKRSR